MYRLGRLIIFTNSSHESFINTHLSKTIYFIYKNYISYHSVDMTKYMKKETKKEVFILAHNLKVKFITVEKAWQLEHEVACHIASVAGSRE